MPFTLYDADISGSGSAPLGGTRVFYVAWDITNLGALGHVSTGIDDNAVLSVGGFALGDNFAIGSGSAEDRWHEFHWFNSEFGLWTPIPSADSTGFLSVVATRIRWAFGVDGTAHIYVFGDA
jgi:hypothetical protein